MPAYTENLEVVYCPRCGVPFGITSQHQAILYKGIRGFYCPNGHRQRYPKAKNPCQLNDTQRCDILAAHEAEQAEAKAAEAAAMSKAATPAHAAPTLPAPPAPPMFHVEGSQLVCQCGKRFMLDSSSWARRHLSQRHGVPFEQAIALIATIVEQKGQGISNTRPS